MKKRPNSQIDKPETSTSNSRSTTPVNSSRSYLSMLKQLSTAHKTTKALKKTEPIVSSWKPPNLRGQISKPALRTASPEQKIKGIITPFSQKPSSRKMSNPLVASTIQTNSRANLKVGSKTPEVSYIENESNASAQNTRKNNQISPPKRAGGSFCLSNSAQNDASYLLGLEHPKKHSSMASLDLTSGPKLSANLPIYREEQQTSSNKSQFSPIKERNRTPQATNSDFLNESLEILKEGKLSAGGNAEGFKPALKENCLFHPHKQAKYYTIDKNECNVQYKVCSKCAVALANKGSRVHEIIFSEVDHRKSEIDDFMTKIAQSKRNSLGLIQHLNLKKNEFLEFFDEQHEKAVALARRLQQLIKEELENVVNLFENQRTQIMNTVSTLEKKLNLEFKDIDEMKTDIELNLDNILNNIEVEPFEKIMGSYQARLKESDAYFEAVRQQKIEIFQLSREQFNQKEEIMSKIQALFELKGNKTPIVSTDETGLPSEYSILLNRSAWREKRNHSCSSSENKGELESGFGSLFEMLRERERHGQSEKANTTKHMEREKTFPSARLDTDGSGLTLKTPQGRRITSDTSSGETYRFKKNIGCSTEDGVKLTSGSHGQDFELQTVHSNHSSCLGDVMTIRQIENSEWNNSEWKGLLEENKDKSTQAQAGTLTEPNLQSPFKIKLENTEEVESSKSGRISHNTPTTKDRNDKEENCLSFSESKYKCYPFAKRKSARDLNDQRQIKSHNSSFNQIEDAGLLNHTISQPLYQGPNCSPKFREKLQ